MSAICRYFALCVNVAVGTTEHPVLTPVPTCQRCADRFGLTITPFPEAAPYVCAECGEPFSDDPHTRDDGEDVHAECCVECNSSLTFQDTDLFDRLEDR